MESNYKLFRSGRELIFKEMKDVESPYNEIQAYSEAGYVQVIFNREIMIALLGKMVFDEGMEFVGLSYLSGLEVARGGLVELMYEVITNFDRLYEGEDEISKMVFAHESGEIEFRINGSVLFRGDSDKDRILYETRRVVNSCL